MIRISQMKMDYKADPGQLKAMAARKLHIAVDEIEQFKIIRKSIDARKGAVQAVYTIELKLSKENTLLKKFKNDNNISQAKELMYQFPMSGSKALNYPPVIAGSGPAGLFCGLMLARHGFRPVIFERGAEVRTRHEKVNRFWADGTLDPQCNVQFGEGGAGTFSDGKLNTLVKDSFGRNKKVLEIFHEAGAPEEILYLNKPHIGTDILMDVVENMRNEIISLGGQVNFDSEITDIKIENNQITAIEVNHNKLMETHVLVLAIGHSARDTFEMLLKHQLPMTPKAFAVGVRIEHPQSMIDQAQYGRPQDKMLPAADYKLTHPCENGRSVYTFCMCPGGYVVNASSEAETAAVNGMSYSDRAGENANSAVIVSVTPKDFDCDGPLAGVAFQRKLEHACFIEAKNNGGSYHIPVQRFDDFCSNRQSTEYGQILPAHRGKVVFGNLRNCLPEYICESLCEGIHAFGRKIKGFDCPDALLSGIESRTSSPVRIERHEDLQSAVKGIYPCGEGAGYAGGITSAAMDGLKVAEKIAEYFAPLTTNKNQEGTLKGHHK